MDIAEEWSAVVHELLDEVDPSKRPRAVERLWQLCLRMCRSMLASFDDVSPDERDGVVTDFFYENLERLTKVRSPQSFVVPAVRRRAIDRFRKGQVRRAAVASLLAAATWDQEGTGGEEERVRALDRERALMALPPRDRDVILAVFVFSEDRDDVARSFRMGRANVDQIIARFRRRNDDEGPPVPVRSGRSVTSQKETS